MTDPTRNVLTERVNRLGREGLKRIGVAVALGFAAVSLMGQAKPGVPKVIEAEKFVLRDAASGTSRAFLQTQPDGSPALSLHDRNGKERVSLAMMPDDTALLAFYGPNGTSRAILGSPFDGAQGLVLYDPTGNRRASLTVSSGGSSILTLRDPSGKSGISAFVNFDGAPGVVLLDSDQKPQIFLAVVNGAPQLDFHDQAGRRRLTLRVSTADGPGGGPVVSLFDEAGNTRAGVGMGVVGVADEQGKIRAGLGWTGLTLYDKDGKVVTNAEGGDKSRSGRTWVLWAQTFRAEPQRNFALGAWTTQAECEAARVQRHKAQEASVVFVLACLPDNVDLHNRP